MANGVREGDAHEALSDVYATLGMARKFRDAQPRLWDYALKLRDKKFAASLLDTIALTPALHISQRYPASRLCAAPVLPLARHPRIDTRVIVFDLDGDPDALLQLDAEDIADRLYTPAADLPAGEKRVPLKEVHLNRRPALVAWSHLREEDFARLRIDRAAAEAVRRSTARPDAAQLAEKMRQVFGSERAHASPMPMLRCTTASSPTATNAASPKCGPRRPSTWTSASSVSRIRACRSCCSVIAHATGPAP